MIETTIIEELRIGKFNFLGIKFNKPDTLCIATFKHPKWLHPSTLRFRIILGVSILLIVPYLIFIFSKVYRQVGTYKINQPHDFNEGDVVKVQLNQDEQIVNVEHLYRD